MSLVNCVVMIVENMKVTLAKLPPKLALGASITLLTAACASGSGQQALSAVSATDGKVADTEKLVCHSEKKTGTNFPTKTCKTADQWNEIDKKQRGDAYDYTRQTFENGAVGGAKNCGQSGGAASC